MGEMYHCPKCGRELRYKGLCWQCEAEWRRQGMEGWTPEQVREKREALMADLERLREDSWDNDFWALLSYHNAIAPEFQRAALAAELYYPSEIYYRAPEDVRDGLAQALLETEDPMAVVDGILIPALDRVGADFEAGKVFLPQLIQAAGAAQAAFEVIREQLSARPGGESAPKAPIVLATVKGDIHDIGKNIVKVLLENYGYPVIDLGKDVEPAAVVEAAKRHAAPLVGLSALMTTTLGSMEETIRLLRAEQVACKVVVGGAVLTADYAKKIGADFYAKDAKESVDVARQVIG